MFAYENGGVQVSMISIHSYRFREDPGQPHCYNAVFDNEYTQAFIDQRLQEYSSGAQKSPDSFTLTVAIPSESGSLHGYRVLALETPGRCVPP